jgi:uncharacterized protein (DUF1919 family)
MHKVYHIYMCSSTVGKWHFLYCFPLRRGRARYVLVIGALCIISNSCWGMSVISQSLHFFEFTDSCRISYSPNHEQLAVLFFVKLAGEVK